MIASARTRPGVINGCAKDATPPRFCPTAPTLVKQWDGSMKPTYNLLGAIIIAPECWDGKNLDSPNHRDHVSYHVDNHTGGWDVCPSTHPYVIPTFQLAVWFSVDPNVGTWHLASDEMRPDLPAGSTFHADWFGAWDNQIEAIWMDNCINKLLSCSGGELGNGKTMTGTPVLWTANPHTVPIP